MSNNETIVNIIAEMRGLVKPGETLNHTYELLNGLADRIEAAQKTEVGNGAKWREALELCVKQMSDAICDKDFGDDVVYLVGCMKTCIDYMKAVLAEPHRNCDKYTSLDKAQNAYMAINEMPEGNHDEDMRRWLCNFHNWLFAPYESEVKK